MSDIGATSGNVGRKVELLLDLRRFAQARQLLESETSLESDPEAKALTALCAAAAGEHAGAEAMADAAIEADPNCAFAHLVRSLVLVEQRRRTGKSRRAEALRHVEIALALNPDEPYAYAVKAGLLLDSEGPDRQGSLAVARAGMSLDPNHFECQIALVTALVFAYKEIEALDAAEQLVGRYPEEARAHLARHLALLANSRLPDAEEALNVALSLEPTCGQALDARDRIILAKTLRWVKLTAFIVIEGALIVTLVALIMERPWWVVWSFGTIGLAWALKFLVERFLVARFRRRRAARFSWSS